MRVQLSALMAELVTPADAAGRDQLGRAWLAAAAEPAGQKRREALGSSRENLRWDVAASGARKPLAVETRS